MIAQAALAVKEREGVSPLLPSSCFLPPHLHVSPVPPVVNLAESQLATKKCGVQRPSAQISMQNIEAGLGAMRQ